MNRPEGSLRPLRQEKVRNLIEIYRKYKNEEKKMPLKTIAIYREGCLKPLEPLDLQEGETVIVVARHSIGFIEKFIKDQTSLTSIIFKKIPATKAALAKWEDNSLKPLEPLDLQEGETILIEILKTSSSIAEKIPGSIVYIEEDPIKILSSERR